MNIRIEHLILIFLCCVVFSVFYWHIVHPVILKRIRFHLFEMRDEVRAIAAERSLGTSFVYRDLERFICRTIEHVPQISLMSFIWFASRHAKHMDRTEYEDQFSREAPAEFIKIREATARDALVILMLNSPWEVILMSVPAPILWVEGKLSRLSVYRDARDFVATIEPDSALRIRTAC
jgi:hypothetical protein